MFGFLTVMDVKVAVLCAVTSCCVLDIYRLLEEVVASVIRVDDENSRFLRDVCMCLPKCTARPRRQLCSPYIGLIIGDGAMKLLDIMKQFTSWLLQCLCSNCDCFLGVLAKLR